MRARRETPGARVERASTRFRMQNKLQAFLQLREFRISNTLRGGGSGSHTAREAMRAERTSILLFERSGIRVAGCGPAFRTGSCGQPDACMARIRRRCVAGEEAPGERRGRARRGLCAAGEELGQGERECQISGEERRLMRGCCGSEADGCERSWIIVVEIVLVVVLVVVLLQQLLL